MGIMRSVPMAVQQRKGTQASTLKGWVPDALDYPLRLQNGASPYGGGAR